MLQHDGTTCTRSVTSVFAAKLICANRPLMPFFDASAALYADRFVTSRSNRIGLPPSDSTEVLPTLP